MTNDEGMTKSEARDGMANSSFVIRHFAAALCLAAAVQSTFAVEPLEEIVEQKYDVDPAVSLELQNIDGSIRVYGADQPIVSIQAIKKAYNAKRLRDIV